MVSQEEITWKTLDFYHSFQSWAVKELRQKGNFETALDEMKLTNDDEIRVSRLCESFFPVKLKVYPRFAHKCSLAALELVQEAREEKDIQNALCTLNRGVAMAPHPPITDPSLHRGDIFDSLDEVSMNSQENRYDELCDALSVRSALLLETGELSLCLRDVQTALTLDPTTSQKWQLLETAGICAAKLGDAAKAESLLRRSLTEARKDTAGNSAREVARLTGVVVNQLKVLRESSSAVSHQREQNKKEVLLPPLSYGPHSTITSASSGVRLEYSEDLGRHLVAGRPFGAGDVIIVEEPFAWTLLPDSYGTHCLYCCARTLAPLPCHSCAKVQFCSAECRWQAWNRFHHYECQFLDLLDSKSMGKMALLAYRIILCASAEGLSRFRLKHNERAADAAAFGLHPEDIFASQDYASVYYQVTHSNARSKEDLMKRTLGAIYLKTCLRQSGFTVEANKCNLEEDWLAGLLLRHLQSCACNAYEICETVAEDGDVRRAEDRAIGGAVYTTVSLTNHSCTSNTVRHFMGRTCVVRAYRPIAEGEPITDNYGYHFQNCPRKMRLTELEQLYLFKCNCLACVENWLPVTSQPRLATVQLYCPECKAKITVQQKKKKCLGCGVALQPTFGRLDSLRKCFQEAKTLLVTSSKSPPADIIDNAVLLLDLLCKMACEPNLEILQIQQFLKLCWSFQGNVFIPKLPAEK